MSVRLRLTAFALGLLALFVVGWGVGRAVGPLDQPEPTAPMDHSAMWTEAVSSGPAVADRADSNR